MKIEIKRLPDTCCDTYFSTANEIAKIPHPVGSVEWNKSATAKIKRFGHHEKLSVYQRIHLYFGRDFTGKTMEYFLRIKVETHKDFSTRCDEDIV